MTDKPYEPRVGGRYVIDKDTGERRRVEDGKDLPAEKPKKTPTTKPGKED